MYERRLILLGITLILFSSLSISTILQPTSAQTANFLTYENPTYGFRIQYPADQNITEDGAISGVVEFRSPDRSSLSINVQNTSQYLDTDTLTLKSRTPQDYVSERIATQSNTQSFTFKYIRDNETMIAGNPARSLEYIMTFLDYGIGLYYKDIYTIKDNRTYSFTYDSFPLLVPKTLPIAQKMIDSFEFIK